MSNRGFAITANGKSICEVRAKSELKVQFLTKRSKMLFRIANLLKIVIQKAFLRQKKHKKSN